MPEPEPSAVRLSEAEEAYWRKLAANRASWERGRGVPQRIQWIAFALNTTWVFFALFALRAIGLSPWLMLLVMAAGTFGIYRWLQSHRTQ